MDRNTLNHLQFIALLDKESLEVFSVETKQTSKIAFPKSSYDFGEIISLLPWNQLATKALAPHSQKTGIVIIAKSLTFERTFKETEKKSIENFISRTLFASTSTIIASSNGKTTVLVTNKDLVTQLQEVSNSCGIILAGVVPEQLLPPFSSIAELTPSTFINEEIHSFLNPEKTVAVSEANQSQLPISKWLIGFGLIAAAVIPAMLVVFLYREPTTQPTREVMPSTSILIESPSTTASSEVSSAIEFGREKAALTVEIVPGSDRALAEEYRSLLLENGYVMTDIADTPTASDSSQTSITFNPVVIAKIQTEVIELLNSLDPETLYATQAGTVDISIKL